jgi:hypothetical protein
MLVRRDHDNMGCGDQDAGCGFGWRNWGRLSAFRHRFYDCLHRRADALFVGRVQVERLRRELASPPLPRDGQGRIMVHGRGRNAARMIPGWPYSFVAALEPGRTSWTGMLDAARLQPLDDQTLVTPVSIAQDQGARPVWPDT